MDEQYLLPEGWRLTETQPKQVNGSEMEITNGKAVVVWTQQNLQQVFSVDGEVFASLPQFFSLSGVASILARF